MVKVECRPEVEAANRRWKGSGLRRARPPSHVHLDVSSSTIQLSHTLERCIARIAPAVALFPIVPRPSNAQIQPARQPEVAALVYFG